jgi:hypothetical protein
MIFAAGRALTSGAFSARWDAAQLEKPQNNRKKRPPGGGLLSFQDSLNLKAVV